MIDLLLRQARLAPDGPLQDLAMQDGRIAALGPKLTLEATEVWDLGGQVVLPGLVDLHTHLDKTYSLLENQSGTLLEAITVWGAYKKSRTPEMLYQAAKKALKEAIAHGTRAMRSHIDINSESDLAKVEVLLFLREEMQALIDLQFVALGNPGFDAEANGVMAQALAMGVDLIGGAPSLTANPQHAIDQVIALAHKTGKAIDLHIDETEDPQMCALAYLAEACIAHNLQGQITAGHCCSLAFVSPEQAAPIIDNVAAAEINIVTLPSCNLVLMGRDLHPSPRGITPVKNLLAAGVRVCAASDNVRDPFNPFGSYDLLQIANLNAHVAHLSGEGELYQSLAMVSDHPAQIFGGRESGLRVGGIADLVVLQTTNYLDAVLAPPSRLATIKAGKIIYRQKIETQWHL